ncbi:unnamed protein product [Rhodiola kirilowii]
MKRRCLAPLLMNWRIGWLEKRSAAYACCFYGKEGKFVPQFAPFNPIFGLSTAACYSLGYRCYFCSLNGADQACNGRDRLVLTHKNVLFTLMSCSSDIMRLSFFIWCAKQPGYSHDRSAVDCMVSVVERLIKRSGNVRGIIGELEAVGCPKKPRNFLLLLRVFWAGGSYQFAYEAVEEMVRLGYTVSTFTHNVIIDVLFKIGRPDMALKALEDVRTPNFLTFNITLQHLSKMRDMFNIKRVFSIMLCKGYYPNENTFGMVVDCFCKAGQLRQAFQVLSFIVVLGMKVSVPVWSMLIDGFARTERISEAHCLLDKMVKTDTPPNVVTYTSLIKGSLRSRNIGDALQILSGLERSGCKPDLVLCNVLVDCFSKIGFYDDAFSVYDGLSEQTLQPDSYTFTSVMSAICKSRRFALAPQLLEGCKMKADLAVCNSILSYYTKAGCPSSTVRFYLDMIYMNYTPDDFTLLGLLNGLCKAGRVDDAVSVYQGILTNRSDLAPHIHCVVIDGLFKAGNSARAMKLLNRLVEHNYPVDDISYTVAIRGLFRARRASDAFILFNQMKEAGLHPNAHTYSVMLYAFCKSRDVKSVRQILHDMAEARVVLGFRTSMMLIRFAVSDSVSDLLYEMCSLGLLHEKAMQMIMSMDFACSGGAERGGQNLTSNDDTHNPSADTCIVHDLSAAVG